MRWSALLAIAVMVARQSVAERVSALGALGETPGENIDSAAFTFAFADVSAPQATAKEALGEAGAEVGRREVPCRAGAKH